MSALLSAPQNGNFYAWVIPYELLQLYLVRPLLQSNVVSLSDFYLPSSSRWCSSSPEVLLIAGCHGSWHRNWHRFPVEALNKFGFGAGAIGAGFTFVPAYDSLSCSSVCSAQGLASATLKSSDGPMQTSVCEVNVTGQGRLSGYQEGGSSSCNVVSSSLAGNFSDYSCLCLQLDATPGLATATGSSCSAACDQSIDGLTGSAIATESSEASYTCLPTPEIGESSPLPVPQRHMHSGQLFLLCCYCSFPCTDPAQE